MYVHKFEDHYNYTDLHIIIKLFEKLISQIGIKFANIVKFIVLKNLLYSSAYICMYIHAIFHWLDEVVIFQLSTYKS